MAELRDKYAEKPKQNKPSVGSAWLVLAKRKKKLEEQSKNKSDSEREYDRQKKKFYSAAYNKTIKNLRELKCGLDDKLQKAEQEIEKYIHL